MEKKNLLRKFSTLLSLPRREKQSGKEKQDKKKMSFFYREEVGDIHPAGNTRTSIFPPFSIIVFQQRTLFLNSPERLGRGERRHPG